MGKVKKLINESYLSQAEPEHFKANEANRAYIDRFVSLNYERLSRTFSKLPDVMDGSGFNSMDKLHEMIFRLYTDSGLCFPGWDEADEYLTNQFTAKSIRVVAKASPDSGDGGNTQTGKENNFNEEEQ